jgi:hypothetical protein
VAKYYLSNPLLKAANVNVQFTQEQIQEYIKCKDDPIYFIKTYVKIISLDHGLIPFNLYTYQEKFIRSIHEENRVISMQPRQHGKSQTVAAYILHYTLFNDNKTVAILANKKSAATEILSRYQQMFECLPPWLQQGVTTWNKGDIKLENGSIVFTAATSASGIRGKSVNLLYVDETAIIANTVAEEFFTSTYPTISSGKKSKIILTSTPLGYNHFWHFWQGAEAGINGFKAIRVNYWEHPDHDQEWANKQKELLGELKFNQEVLCSFLGSSLTLVSADVFSKMQPKLYLHQKDGLDVFEAPIEKHTYVLVADTAEGVGGDYSAFSVIDVTEVPYKQVAKYRNNKISPLLYPNVIYKIAKEYNSAYVLIELNFSEQVAYILHNELEYDNILYVTRSTKGQIVSSGFGGGQTQYGVVTDKKVKRIGCHTFKSLIEENKLIINDPDTIAEISTFIEKKGSYMADDGYNDDLVMTLVLFSWVTTSPYFKDLNNVNLREIMYQNRILQIESELTPIGWFNDGNAPEDQPLLNF